MPKQAHILKDFNPIRYFVEIIRMVILKGYGFWDILPLALETLAYAVFSKRH
jgi:ABC-2 type transport system permease protein